MISVILILFPFVMAGIALATSMNTTTGFAHDLLLLAPMGMWIGVIMLIITLIVHRSKIRKAEEELE